jgi:hypothetical protein
VSVDQLEVVQFSWGADQWHICCVPAGEVAARPGPVNFHYLPTGTYLNGVCGTQDMAAPSRTSALGSPSNLLRLKFTGRLTLEINKDILVL